MKKSLAFVCLVALVLVAAAAVTLLLPGPTLEAAPSSSSSTGTATQAQQWPIEPPGGWFKCEINCTGGGGGTLFCAEQTWEECCAVGNRVCHGQMDFSFCTNNSQSFPCNQ